MKKKIKITFEYDAIIHDLVSDDDILKEFWTNNIGIVNGPIISLGADSIIEKLDHNNNIKIEVE